MKKESKLAALAALAANVAIAAIKSIVAGITGSAAMLAEGVHSLVDTGNQLLMFVGMRRSRRPPDKGHPFGHGKELHFWNLMVAVLISGVGGGTSAYEGVQFLGGASRIRRSTWNS